MKLNRIIRHHTKERTKRVRSTSKTIYAVIDRTKRYGDPYYGYATTPSYHAVYSEANTIKYRDETLESVEEVLQFVRTHVPEETVDEILERVEAELRNKKKDVDLMYDITKNNKNYGQLSISVHYYEIEETWIRHFASKKSAMMWTHENDWCLNDPFIREITLRP